MYGQHLQFSGETDNGMAKGLGGISGWTAALGGLWRPQTLLGESPSHNRSTTKQPVQSSRQSLGDAIHARPAPSAISLEIRAREGHLQLLQLQLGLRSQPPDQQDLKT